MDFAALQRGETPALSSFLEQHTELIWQLARRGFAARDGERRVLVQGLDKPSSIEKLTVAVLAEALSPARRATLQPDPELKRSLLEIAQRQMLARAEAEGRELTLEDEEGEPLPSGVLDLDAPDRLSDRQARDDLPEEDVESFQRALLEFEALGSRLAERDRVLLERRLRSAEPRAQVAAALAASVPSVKEGERRLVRHLLHQLRQKGLVPERADAAFLEALLAGDPRRTTLPARTAERIKESVLRRTFVDEPRPYARRAAVALGSLAIALGLYALMFFGVLPGPADDPAGEVEVVLSCEAVCTAHSSAQVSVRAPRRARRVALWMRSPDGSASPLISESGGRSVILPLGAKERLTPVLTPFTLPADWGDRPYEIVAVFSNERLSIAALQAHVEGSRLLPKVATHRLTTGP